jgi:hypothetical protein
MLERAVILPSTPTIGTRLDLRHEGVEAPLEVVGVTLLTSSDRPTFTQPSIQVFTIDAWLASWEIARRLYAAQVSLDWPAGRGFREALELFCVCLMYQRNALQEYGNEVPHALLRGNSPHLNVEKNLSGTMDMEAPVFGRFSRPERGRGHAHLASVSFRLPEAVLRTAAITYSDISGTWPFEANGVPAPTFNWSRKAGADHFSRLKVLGCCQNGRLTHEQAAVIVILHRDDFGHGEEGSDRDAWTLKAGKAALTHFGRAELFKPKIC